jgi:hypothetical protein
MSMIAENAKSVNFPVINKNENHAHSSIPKAPIPVSASCNRCYSQRAEIRPVASHLPHAGGLYCAECGKWIKWLGADQKVALLAQGGVA